MAQAFMNLWMVRRYRQARQAQMKHRKVMRRALRDLNNPFELDETEFRDLFRISREMARDICAELGELGPKKSFGVSVQIKVLTGIRILAVGSYQRGTGQDYLLALGQTTVSKFLRQFLELFLQKFYGKWIQFPATDQSRQLVSQGYEDKFQLPNILGCIDCTHVAVSTPHQHPESYLNRHGFHSLNVQLICDVDGKIINVNARYPGRTHDQFIFKYSVIRTEMIKLYDNHVGDFHLIGDSGYALEPWMMTPIVGADPDSGEGRFTKRITEVRSIIERVNGTLKATWRCLKRERVMHYQPLIANKMINASCVLYNMMRHYRVAFPEPELDVEDVGPREYSMPAAEGGHLLSAARIKRQRLVQELQI